MSLREWLCGHRSVFFLAIMLARLTWVVFQTVEYTHAFDYALIGGSIFVKAVLIASPDGRLRAPAVGILCGLIWSYALTDPASIGSPRLSFWPELLTLAAAATLIEIWHGNVESQLAVAMRDDSHARAARLGHLAAGLQIVSAALFLSPLAVIGVTGAFEYGVSVHSLIDAARIAFSLPPVVGTVVYALLVVRRARTLPSLTLGA